ncbi:VCBS repeat-containing protein, partial [bacterium]
MKRVCLFCSRFYRNNSFVKFFLLVFIILSSSPGFLFSQIFTKVQSAEINALRGRTFGAGWLDYNGDGYPDIWNNNYDADCNLYINNKDGSFTWLTSTEYNNPGTYFSGLTWGDYNNDGNEDLFLTTLQGGNVLFSNNGDGNFERVDAVVNNVPDIHLHAAWVDYDNDGWLDLFVPTASSFNFAAGGGTRNYLFHNDEGVFSRVNDGELLTMVGNNQCGNFSDIDNDGDMDLFITEWEKDNWLFENINGTFSKIDNAGLNTNTNASMNCVWGDFDNDGYMDLYVGNGTGGTVRQQNLLYHNNQNKTFTKILNNDAVNFGGNTWTSLSGDFDNDGDLDLFTGELTDTCQVFLNDGKGNF